MIFFSFLTMVTAGQLAMEHVKDDIYRTKPPLPQIAAFDNSPEKAGHHAWLLNQYQLDQASQNVTVEQKFSTPLGIYGISLAEYVTGKGWVLHHKGLDKKTDFISYVVSARNDWNQFKTTVDATLKRFMEGYTAAFPQQNTKIIPQWSEPTPDTKSGLEKKINELFEQQILQQGINQRAIINAAAAGGPKQVCELFYKGIKSEWEKTIFATICENNPYNLLYLRACIYEKRLAQEKQDVKDKIGNSARYLVIGDLITVLDSALNTHYEQLLDQNIPRIKLSSDQNSLHCVRFPIGHETRSAKEREVFDRLSKEKKYEQMRKGFDDAVKKPFVYLERLSQYPDGWGGNHCLFLAKSAHPVLLQETVNLLWEGESVIPQVTQLFHPTPESGYTDFSRKIAERNPNLGRELRTHLIAWLRKHQNDYLYTDPETDQRFTIKDFIKNVKPGYSSSTGFEDYITNEITGTVFMAAELYDLLSICLKRHIISVTGPHGSWNAQKVQCQSPRLDQISIRWRSETEAPTVYVLTQPNYHHWATEAHLVS